MVNPARVQDQDPPTAGSGSGELRSRLGFRDGDRGTHSSRTLMLRELEMLLEADTALANPLAGDAADLARGKELFDTFCVVCHGTGGQGDGSVVGPNRMPPLPLLNLTSPLTRGYSDGYIWGMITNGRGLMPSYRRIPAEDRWYIVSYVRELQRRAGPGAGGGR